MHQRAFTLVELAIVLVIIGLIVGGVLVGQSLIAAATIKAQLTQIDKMNQAVNAFRGKYGGIPGDLVIAKATEYGFSVPSTCTGLQGGRDGNGLIDGFNIPGQIYPAVMGENALFWDDLAHAGLIQGKPSGNVNPNICTASPTTFPSLDGVIPTATIGFGAYLHVYEANGVNWYQLAQATQNASSALVITPSIPVIMARDMDSKIDDEIATTGTVRAIAVNGQWALAPINPQATDSATSCYNTGNNKYSTAINDGQGHNCALSFRFQ